MHRPREALAWRASPRRKCYRRSQASVAVPIVVPVVAFGLIQVAAANLLADSAVFWILVVLVPLADLLSVTLAVVVLGDRSSTRGDREVAIAGICLALAETLGGWFVLWLLSQL